jgi:hypothetical protein
MPKQPSSTPQDGPEPTTSTSGEDASTTEGNPAQSPQEGTQAPSSAGGAATAQQANTVRVEVAQAPPEPDVLYPGDQKAATDPQRKHVRADYQPFVW